MNQSNHAHGVFAIPTIERRVVLKASAWSVPVVAVASSVPFAAATGGTMSLLSAVWAPSTTYLTLTLLFEPAPVGVPTVEVTSDDTTVVPVSTAVISGGTVQVVVALPAAASGDSIVLDIASTGYSSLSEQVTLTAGGLDTSFDPGTGLNNVGWDVAVQSDGKIVVIGGFITVDGVGRNCVARLNTDGSLDTSFDPGSGLNSGGLALVLQPDGKIIVAGDFTTVDGIGRNRIARLNTDGSLDTTFDPGSGLNSGGLSLALQSDGKIIVSGFFSSVDGVARARIARLNADGSLDTTFDPGSGLNSGGRALAVQPDGKIIVTGLFTTVAGVGRNRIARLNADGSLDTSFNPGTGLNVAGWALALQPDGKIVIAGGFTTVGGVGRNYIARLHADGSLDATFNPGLGNTGISLALQSDGKIIVCGDFITVGGIDRARIARLNADGSLDTTFDPGTGLSDTGRAVAVQSDGKIIVSGFFTTVGGVTRNRIARLHG